MSILPTLYQSYSTKHVTDPELSLYAAKSQKKMADIEAMKIQNRIQFFKSEEAKLNKKIKETDQRALGVYLAKKRNQDKKNNKECIPKKDPFSYQVYLTQKEAIKKARDEEEKKRQIQAMYIKHRNIKDEAQLKDDKEMYIQKLKQRARVLKSQEFEAYNNINSKYEQKHAQIRASIRDETLQLQFEKLQYEKMIRKLEVQELQALQELQETQVRQEDVIYKYKSAKSMNPLDFEQTYDVSQVNQSQLNASLTAKQRYQDQDDPNNDSILNQDNQEPQNTEKQDNNDNNNDNDNNGNQQNDDQQNNANNQTD